MIAKTIYAGDIKFEVRSLVANDIPHIVNYWLKASSEDLIRMGADASKLSSPDQLKQSLMNMLEQSFEKIRVCYVIWLVNDTPIGFSSLKNIQFEESGEIHLHMWRAAMRGAMAPFFFVCRA